MADNFCPNCGAEVAAGAKFCSSCGKNLRDDFATGNISGKTVRPPTAPPEYLDRPRYQEDSTFLEMFLSINGRLNRFRYFKRSFLLLIIETILAFAIVAAFMEPSGQNISTAGYIAFILMIIVFVPPHYMLMIRRLHDLNKTGWMCLIMLIPLVNTIFSFYVLFAPGTVGYNQYGADPVEGVG